ncbi:hypothetical protein [Marinicella gelatinilytica]|uniref:hypothetical protein n=1 Tax=Marinicella gelatinilytica TaxID=2996017 RepID=UPI002260A4CA|nr:hypothetical protein [Marinicella gelatinilytica]MCX7545890.1 hypothetical protein [Marinicella gelatinilytica]
MHKLIIFINIVISGTLLAGTADLALELEFNEFNGVVYEPQGDFIARITNLGPDVAADNIPFPLPLTTFTSAIDDNGNFTPEIQFSADTQNNNQECYFTLAIGSPPPGSIGPKYVYGIDIPSLAVNETIECHGIFSRHFQSGTRDVTWQTYNSFDHDPNTDNNSQVITFGIPPKAVSVNNVFALVLLLLLVFYFGYHSKSNDDIKNIS